MSAQVTGTATAARTTSPAAPAASSALLSRTMLPSTVAALVPLMVGTCRARGATASAAAPSAPAALAGSLATGFAPGLDAMSTTSPAGWSASGATHRGTPALRCNLPYVSDRSGSDEACSSDDEQQKQR
uniref:Uncharacterized protein n=1 Tax=Oryza rufipogon TaxID=4529 RepID=A0A0E0NBC4_ORYRU